MSTRGIRNFLRILSDTMVIAFIITHNIAVRMSDIEYPIFRKIGRLSFVAFIVAMKSHAQTISFKIILLENCFIFKFKTMKYGLKLYAIKFIYIIFEKEKNNVFFHFKLILKNIYNAITNRVYIYIH